MDAQGIRSLIKENYGKPNPKPRIVDEPLTEKEPFQPVIIDHSIKKYNRRNAIRKQCVECSSGSYKEIENCEFTDCPLFPYRAGKGKQNAKARSKDIRRYCLWCVGDQRGEVGKCHIQTCTLWPYRKTVVERFTMTLSEAKQVI